MLYQASTAMKGDVRRSGTTPPPIAASPWQTLQNRPNRASPVLTVAASAVAGGGSSGSAASGGRGGKLPFAPSLNTSTRLTFRVLPDLSESLPCISG